MYRRLHYVVLPAVLLSGLLASPVLASLSAPPASYVKPVGDGRHFLVMLAATPPAEDTGNLRTLPDGRTVLLRDTFPASGLYRYGAVVPEWAVGLYEEQGLVQVSPDARYLVVVNRLGGCDGVHLQWGIRFFDRGALIRNYDVAELVDFPSLMTYPSCDWIHLWIDESVYDHAVRSGRFTLTTSTRDEFTFDVATGALLAEFRYWRTIARRALIVAALGALAVASVFARRVCLSHSPLRLVSHMLVEPGPRRSAFLWQLSLWRLVIVLPLAVLLLAWAGMNPRAVAVCGAASSPILVGTLLGRILRRPAAARFHRAVLWIALIAAMAGIYVLSSVPVMRLTVHWRCDSRAALAETVYLPLVWVSRHTSLWQSGLARFYIDAWDKVLRPFD